VCARDREPIPQFASANQTIDSMTVHLARAPSALRMPRMAADEDSCTGTVNGDVRAPELSVRHMAHRVDVMENPARSFRMFAAN
jgi:hypothetical protein